MRSYHTEEYVSFIENMGIHVNIDKNPSKFAIKRAKQIIKRSRMIQDCNLINILIKHCE